MKPSWMITLGNHLYVSNITYSRRSYVFIIIWYFIFWEYTFLKVSPFFLQDYLTPLESEWSSQPRDWTQVSCTAGGSLPSKPPGKPKNTGVGTLSLLQGIFPTQRSNLGLPHCGRFFTSWATREAQEYWSGYPIPFPADLPDLGIKLGSPALQADSLPTELLGKPINIPGQC